MKPYPELLESLLVLEFGKTPARAEELVKNNPSIVTQGIMQGNQSLRGCAMLLDDLDCKERAAIERHEKEKPNEHAGTGTADTTSRRSRALD